MHGQEAKARAHSYTGPVESVRLLRLRGNATPTGPQLSLPRNTKARYSPCHNKSFPQLLGGKVIRDMLPAYTLSPVQQRDRTLSKACHLLASDLEGTFKVLFLILSHVFLGL